MSGPVPAGGGPGIAGDGVAGAHAGGSHHAFAARGRARVAVAAVVLVAWLAGLGALVRRDYFHGSVERLAEAALRLSPGATYFAVEQGGRQIGFASTTIDTIVSGVEVVDYFVADLPIGGALHRTSARSVVRLSRGLALQNFDVQIETPEAPMRVGGRLDGDSAIVYALSTPSQHPDSQRLAVRGPILLPTLVPLAIAFGEHPKVGRTYRLPLFDPATMRSADRTLAIRAESLFTVVDSAAFDPARGQWVSALTDTVRAWRVEPADGDRGFSGWVDADGRVVNSTEPGGITLHRMAYEIAFENWRIALDRGAVANAAKSDIIERTAISAGAEMGRSRLYGLSVLLTSVDLRGFDLDGGRQRLFGDTLRVRREEAAQLTPAWSLLRPPPDFRRRFRAELAGEPLLQSGDPRIVSLAVRIAGNDRDPRVIAEKINRWVFDSLKKEVTFSVPNALDVLRTRKGDCNEHTQLFTALTRAVGIPTRIATGLAYVNGKFYYHAWPEVYLGDWVAVDPTFGQFPADAAHLRFVIGGLSRQAELLRLIGNLHIRVMNAR